MSAETSKDEVIRSNDFDAFADLFASLGTVIEDKRLALDFSHKGMWKEDPVGFVTFCREWIREPLFQGPQERLAIEVIGEPTPEHIWSNTYQVILLAWGKGSGKGSLAAKLLTYLGYLLKLMRDPRSYFGIGRTSPIHLINVSYNSFQAKTVFFQGYLVPTVLNTINPKTGVNFFQEQGMDLRVGEADILSQQIHFERPVREGEGGITAVSLAGDKGTAEGFSPLFIFVDEISSMGNAVKAEELVDDLEKSARSRFGNLYKLIVASFKKGKNCLMSMKVADAEAKNLPNVYISKAATWEVNRLKNQKDFIPMYNTNPVKAARTFEFKEMEGDDENAFFKLKDRLAFAFGRGENPFEGEVIKCRSDQLRVLLFKEWFEPIAGISYHLHVDLAKGTQSDRGGLVMAHRKGIDSIDVKMLEAYINGESPEDLNFDVQMDFCLQILPEEKKTPTNPGTGSGSGEIIIEDIRLFIMSLVKLGFNLKVTIDGFQSMDFIQLLRAKGIETELLSVDKNRKPYDSLLSIVNRKTLICYEHPILMRELSELEESDNGRKIDHPLKSIERSLKEDGIDKGSKDLADALCGAVFQAILAPPPRIPLMPGMGMSFTPYDEGMKETMDFERQVTGGLIDVTALQKKNPAGFHGLLPSKG